MANELTLTLALTGNKAGITSGGMGRGVQGLLANMGGNAIAQDTILANHLGNGSITGATNAFPIVLTTSVAHGLTTGETVNISGVTGNTAANGTWVVTVLSSTTFSIPTVGNAAYISGGTWRTDPTTIPLGQVTQPHYAWFNNLDTTNIGIVSGANTGIGSISGATNANPIVVTTPVAHGLSTGTTVSISGVLGNLAANGTFTVTNLTSTTFSIPIAGSGAYTSGGIWRAEPVNTAAYLQALEAGIVPLDPLLAALYVYAPVAAVQLEYLIFSL